MFVANLNGEKVFSSSQEAFTLFEKSCFGEKKDGKIEYSFVEILFLILDKKLTLFSNKKVISFDKFMKKVKTKDKKIETKLSVYSDLRKKGYTLKTALKYGAEFRVYDRGVKPGEDHAKWILYTTKEHDVLPWHDFAAKNRVAHSTKKNLLIAIVDEEEDVSYYEIAWLRP